MDLVRHGQPGCLVLGAGPTIKIYRYIGTSQVGSLFRGGVTGHIVTGCIAGEETCVNRSESDFSFGFIWILKLVSQKINVTFHVVGYGSLNHAKNSNERKNLISLVKTRIFQLFHYSNLRQNFPD